MDQPSSSSGTDRRAVAAARLNFFGGGDKGDAAGTAAPVLEHGAPVESFLEGRLSSILELVTSLHDELESVKSKIDVMHTAVQSELDMVENKIQEAVQTALHAQTDLIRTTIQEAITSAPGQPVKDQEDLFAEYDIGATNAPAGTPDEPAPESDEERRMTCGICHIICRKIVKVLVPCGHYPFCPSCADELQSKKDSIPLFQRDANWDSSKCYCPLCSQPCTRVQQLKALHPYTGNVARID